MKAIGPTVISSDLDREDANCSLCDPCNVGHCSICYDKGWCKNYLLICDHAMSVALYSLNYLGDLVHGTPFDGASSFREHSASCDFGMYLAAQIAKQRDIDCLRRFLFSWPLSY